MNGPMGKATSSDVFAAVYAAATEAARNAILLNSHLERPNALDCGFAWVQVTPGTHPFVRWCRKNNKGTKHWSSGWEFWMPGRNEANFGGQSVAVFQAGAEAFADVLKTHLLPLGLAVHVGTRLD